MIYGSLEWLEARQGLITASKMADVLGSSAVRLTYKTHILAERQGVPPEENPPASRAMIWGTEHEADAKERYWAETGELITEHTGRCHPEYEYVWGTPDGLVGTDGLVEIKCPNSHTHVRYLLDGAAPAQYVAQIQALIWIFNRRWCDFISFDPRNRAYPMMIVRVARDEKYIAKMAAACESLWKEIMAAEEKLETTYATNQTGD